MINLNAPLIPADLPVTLTTLSGLVSLLADPVAAQNRIAEMQTATAALQQATDEQKTQMAAFAVAKAEHQQALAKASSDAAKKRSADQAEFDAECARRKSELDSRADQLAQLQAKAKTDSDAAAATRLEVDRRLALLKQVTA